MYDLGEGPSLKVCTHVVGRDHGDAGEDVKAQDGNGLEHHDVDQAVLEPADSVGFAEITDIDIVPLRPVSAGPCHRDWG